MKFYKSLGSKFTLSFALLGLGPLVLMGLTALMFISLTHRQDVGTMETQLLTQKMREIDKFVEETIGLFEIHANVSGKFIPDKDRDFLLEQLLDENAFIMEASFISLDGNELYSEMQGQKVVSKKSRSQDTTLLQPVNVSQLPKFQKAVSGKHYFGPIYQTLNGPMMTISAPFYNNNGEVIMVLTGEISLLPISKIIAFSNLGSEGYVYLIDESGTVVASSDNKFVFQNISNTEWTKELVAGQSHDGLSKNDQRVGLNGQEVLAAGLPIPKFGWGLVAEWPITDAFAIVKTVQSQVVGFSFITVLIVAGLGWFIGRRVLNPLFVLKQGAQKIGAGEFEHKIDIKTGDEIEELGEVFNKMGHDLKQLEELRATQIKAEALAESLRKERELSRMREEFLSNTSHQLRTPMSIANWNFDLVANAKTEAERTDALNELDTGLRQLNAIIQDLMVVSEYGVGFKNTIFKELKITEMLKKVVESRKSNLDSKKIVYQEELETLPVFIGHPAFQIVLENLLDNAITYTKDKIKFSAKVEGTKLHITIEDNGIGIMEKDKPSIFTQFFRGENAISKKNVGTGLGLLICKNIIEGHGGKIWFESKENSGSKFHVLLPFNSQKLEPVAVSK
ncbi:MAG TPA: sensor histidine kinase [Patescibacteria group bacterium]|jgi:signal transduction histidine kinase|nr:sensor histidine kinase [Patescibacteria group bacterium]